jgi:hypothetical protein
MTKTALILLSTAIGLSACSTPQKVGTPLISDKSIQLTSKLALPYSDLVTSAVVAAAVHFIYDPLAPNWEIEEAQLSDDTYRFSLKMKRFHTGGAGESIQILKRRASQLQNDQGFSSYQLTEYTEGVESQTLGARRVAEGTIKLVQRQQADSFMQNGRN